MAKKPIESILSTANSFLIGIHFMQGWTATTDSWNPPPPTFQKLSHLAGSKFFIRKGDKPEKGGGWCRDGVVTFLLLYSSITLPVCFILLFSSNSS